MGGLEDLPLSIRLLNICKAKIRPFHGDNADEILSYDIRKQSAAAEIKTVLSLMADKIRP